MTDYGKEIANITKIYIKEQKYGSINKSLDYKLTIFYNIYNYVNIPQEAYFKVFPTILKDQFQTTFIQTNYSTYHLPKLISIFRISLKDQDFNIKTQTNKILLYSQQ